MTEKERLNKAEEYILAGIRKMDECGG